MIQVLSYLNSVWNYSFLFVLGRAIAVEVGCATWSLVIYVGLRTLCSEVVTSQLVSQVLSIRVVVLREQRLRFSFGQHCLRCLTSTADCCC